MANEQLTTARIAQIVGGTLQGDPSVVIDSIASVRSAGPKDITFAADDKRGTQLAGSQAAAAIVGQSARAPDVAMPLVRVPNVQQAIAKLLEYLSEPEDLPAVGVASSAVVSPAAELAKDVRIGPGVVIGPGAKIGRGTALLANVSIGSDVQIGRDVVLWEGVSVRRGCKVGDRVRIGSNSVIGYDGFGYYFAEGKHHKIPHIGDVVIEDDVEIGACSCIDRAKFGSTRIGAGSKIDNLVQIAHNVQVGRDCVIASLSGIAGSATLGQYVALGGHVAIRDNINIGTGASCAAYTGVIEDVPDGQAMFGIPAVKFRAKFREISFTRRLPELFKRVGELEKRQEARESSKDH